MTAARPTSRATAPASTHARQRRKHARPQELLQAALELFVEKGFAATRAEEVAQRAGVSKGTLYLYYPSKQALLKAVIAHYLSARIAASAQELQQYSGAIAPLLRDRLVVWWQEMVDSPASGTFKLLIAEACNFPDIADFYAREVIGPGHQLIAEAIERGIASGEFRAVDIENTVHSLVLPMVMLCAHKHSFGASTAHTIDAPQFIADHVDLVVRGLLREATAPAPAA